MVVTSTRTGQVAAARELLNAPHMEKYRRGGLRSLLSRMLRQASIHENRRLGGIGEHRPSQPPGSVSTWMLQRRVEALHSSCLMNILVSGQLWPLWIFVRVARKTFGVATDGCK